MQLHVPIKKSLAFLTAVLMLVTPTFAQAAKTLPILTIDKAVQMGISMDNGLPDYSRKIELYKVKKDATDDLATLEFQNYQTYIQQYTTSKEYRKDVVCKNVLNAYQNIILLTKQIEVYQDNITIQQKLVKQYEIKLKRGMCDQLSYNKQLQALQDQKDELEKAEKSLTYLKADFLRLTNLNIDKYTLEPDYTYEVFDLNKSITSYSSGVATELTKYQKTLAELADANFWETIYNSGVGGTAPTYSSYLEAKMKVADALAIVDSNYKNYKSAIESQYATTSADLNDLKIKEAAYKTAEKDLKVLEIKYNCGYVSDLSYLQQKLSVKSAQLNYLSAIYTYNIDKYQLEKPWCMSIFNY